MNNSPIAQYRTQLIEEMQFWDEEFQESVNDFSYRMLAASMIGQLRYKLYRFNRIAAGLRLGLELKGTHAWCLLLQDASSPGQYRYQVFDERGFSGHSTHPNLEAALVAAFQEGFCEEGEGALLRLYGSDSWQHGMRAAGLIQEVNSGQITHEQAEQRYSA